MSRRDFFWFVGPSVVIMVLLMIIPFAMAIWLGFNFITFDNISDPQWVGLENYQFLLEDSRFWGSLGSTLLYIVITVPFQLVLGFIVALLLDQIKFGRAVYVACALLPFIVTPVVGTYLFRQIYDTYGLYPYLLELMGIDFNFFSTSNIVFSIMAHGIWYVTPFSIIVLFAGLQTVPEEPLEAAVVDGAKWHERIRFVVIPHLRSLFLFISLISIMDAYRVFDSIFVLTKQNPIYQFETLMYYNFRIAINFQRLGRANAMSVLTVVGVVIVLIPFLYYTYKQQTEER